MLRKTTDLIGFEIQASDGSVGKVDDFYFDDKAWTVRYFVVRTGPWLFGNKVLISPHAFGLPAWEVRTIPVDLSQEQVQNSPTIDLDQPVSRQQELELHRYYRWPAYWPVTPGYYSRPAVGAAASLVPPVADEGDAPDQDVQTETGDPHLRSVQEVTGYSICATDGEIGHVEDFFVDETGWRIHFMLVDTRNWLPGKQVLVAPDRIDRVSWDESTVHVKVAKAEVRNSQEYAPLPDQEIGQGAGLYTFHHIPM